jgi:hypothetical protein
MTILDFEERSLFIRWHETTTQAQDFLFAWESDSEPPHVLGEDSGRSGSFTTLSAHLIQAADGRIPVVEWADDL